MTAVNIPPGATPRIRVDNTFGAAFIGAIAAAVLYGFTCLQTYSVYVYHQRQDRRRFRILVLCLWVLDTFHLIAVSGALYFYLVTNYANPAAIFIPSLWTATGYYITTGVMEFAIRGVLTYRVWKLSNKNWILSVAILLMSLVNWGGNLVFTFKNLGIKTFPNLDSIAWLFYMAFCASVMADLLTAVALCFLLKRRQTGFVRTDSFLKTLMIYSVNSGALSSLCSLLVLITYIASRHTFIYVPFYFILPKVMLNSLLATLNASRQQWERAQHEGGPLVTIPMSSVSLDQNSQRSDPQSKYMAEVSQGLQYFRAQPQTKLSNDQKVSPLTLVPPGPYTTSRVPGDLHDKIYDFNRTIDG